MSQGGNPPRKPPVSGSEDEPRSGSPDRAAFARLVLRALRQADEKAEPRYDPDEFQIIVKSGSDTFVFPLAYSYGEYCGAEESKRQDIVQGLCKAWLTRPR
jgi:hypothetical protein